MKLKVAVIAVLAFSVGIGTAFADDLYNDYKAKPVTVTINDKAIATPGLLISPDDKTLGSKTLVPLRDISSALQALVVWDDSTQTVRIYKPDVHMNLLTAKDKKQFANVVPGKLQFQIFTQVDNLQTDISAFKMVITNPDGDPVQMVNADGNTVTDIQEKVTSQKDSFWYISKPVTVNFSETGNYVLNFYMKAKDNSDYSLVSRKDIQSISN